MRQLSTSELLDVWEQGMAQTPVQRGLIMLAAACPKTPPRELAELSIGQRDAYLMALRERIFGNQLVSLTSCPKCVERLELTFNLDDIRVATPTEPTALQEKDREEIKVKSVAVAEYEVRFRLPNSLDLAAITGTQSVAKARDFLLNHCIIAALRDDEETGIEELPAEVIDAVVEEMAKVDPQADVQLDLSCPACDHQWKATFDIISFFWGEINAWAYRLLREVHTLASAYGWREADILAMSPWRRQFYLEMASV